MADDGKNRLAKTAIEICKEIVEGGTEVPQLLERASCALNDGQDENAFRAATEALGIAFHLVAEDLVMAGAIPNRVQSAHWESTAREVLNVYRELGEKKARLWQ